jgi:hypothetical protein
MADDQTGGTPVGPVQPAPALPLPKGVVQRVDPAELLEQAKANQAALFEVSQLLYELPTRRSDTIGQIALALSRAQGKIKGAAKSAENPFFKSKYADLDACWDACREPLSENELAVFQPVRSNGKIVVVTTLLAHSSGEWIEESLTLIATQDTPQGIVAASTYGRRCGLSGMVGISAADDDGNEASRTLPKDTHWDKGTGKLQQEQQPQPQPAAPESAQPAAAPAISVSAPPSAKPPLARPKAATSTAVPPVQPVSLATTVSPPPPGSKPPQRMEP